MRYINLRIVTTTAILVAALGINAMALGQLDLTFGSNGSVYSHLNLSDAKIALQPDGKILKYGISTNGEIHIYRYNSNGTTDLNFGSSGRALPYYPIGSIQSIIVQSDGRIVAAGNSSTNLNATVYVWRFNANGTHDTSFGTNGRSTIVGSSVMLDIAVVKPTNAGTAHNVVIVTRPSSGNGSVVMRRLNTNGTINTSFGSNGVVTLTIPSAIGVRIVTTNGSLFQNDAIYTAMIRSFSTAPYKRIAIAKYTNVGLTDTTFGTSGEFTSNYNLLTTSTLNSFKRITTGKFYIGVETMPFSGLYESRLGVHAANGVLEFLSQGIQGGQLTPHTIYGFRSDGTVVGNHFWQISRLSADLTTILEAFQPTSDYTIDGAVQSDDKLVLIDSDDTIRRYQP